MSDYSFNLVVLESVNGAKDALCDGEKKVSGPLRDAVNVKACNGG